MLHASFLEPGDEQYVSIWVHWHTGQIIILLSECGTVEALKLYYIIIGLWEKYS